MAGRRQAKGPLPGQRSAAAANQKLQIQCRVRGQVQGVKTQGELECLVFHVGRWDQGSEVKVRSNGVGGQKLGERVGLKGSVASKKERKNCWWLEVGVQGREGRWKDMGPESSTCLSGVRGQRSGGLSLNGGCQKTEEDVGKTIQI